MKKTNYKTSLEDVRLTDESAQLLMKASGWAKFLAIVGFIVYGLVILGSIIGAAAMKGAGAHMANTYNTTMQGMHGMYNPGMFSWGTAITLIIIAIVYFIPLYFLLRFATRTQKAFRIGDTPALTEGFHGLKNYFMIMGIFIIITMVFVVLGLIMAMIWGSHMMM